MGTISFISKTSRFFRRVTSSGGGTLHRLDGLCASGPQDARHAIVADLDALSRPRSVGDGPQRPSLHPQDRDLADPLLLGLVGDELAVIARR